jgi:hypothetical protein
VTKAPYIEPDPEMMEKQKLWETISDKNGVLKFELNNLDKIVLFKSGNFWSATQHSCLFLKKVIENKAKPHVIFDKYINQDRTYVSYHQSGVEKLDKELIEKKCKLVRDDGGIKVYWLPSAVLAQQIKQWQKSDEVKQEQIDAYFLPDSGETKLYGYLRSLGSELLVASNRMNQSIRNLVADKLMEFLIAMRQAYSRNEYGKIGDLVADFSFIATIANDEGMIDDKRMMRMGRTLRDIVKELKKLIKKDEV